MEVLDMVRLARDVTDCLAQLSPDERLVLEILTDESDEKIVRLCEELNISRATAYRKKDLVLDRISELFKGI